MNVVTLPDGERVPALGMGTWRLGEDPARFREEAACVRRGLDLGLKVVDTAEMYGEGRTEEFLGKAMAGLRERVFLVSKVYPHNASREGVRRACERSLRRLGTDHLDLYLLHWRGSVPLAETVAGFQDLRAAGKIRRWGVSNFDAEDLEELFALPGGADCTLDQVLYNVTRRGAEYDLLPWMSRHKLPLMAYSPMEQGRLADGGALGEIASRRGLSRWQLALAWVLRRPDTIAIPKMAGEEHLLQNQAMHDLELTAEELARLDAQFAPPRAKRGLEML